MINVTAVDQADNTGIATVNVTVDTTGPGLTVVSPLSGSVITSSQVTAVFSTGDDTSGVDRIEISVDGGPAKTVSAVTTSHVLTGLADGPHTVTLKVFDRAGNSATATVSFRVDTSFVSPSGPYGYGGIAALAIVVLGAAVHVYLALRLRRQGSRPPPPAPPSSP